VGAQFQKQDNEEEEKGTPEVEVIWQCGNGPSD
jgi:hypothetical protein